jgi:protein-tyrosine phosphatase
MAAGACAGADRVAAMHHVTARLMVGGLDDAKNPPSVVEGVLFLCAEHQHKPPPGMLYERIPLREFEEADPAELKRAVDWLERHEPTHRLMVCCRAGMGRSVSVVIAFLCCVKGMSYVTALDLLKSRRPGSTPLPNLPATIEQVRLLRQRGPAPDRTSG